MTQSTNHLLERNIPFFCNRNDRNTVRSHSKTRTPTETTIVIIIIWGGQDSLNVEIVIPASFWLTNFNIKQFFLYLHSLFVTISRNSQFKIFKQRRDVA